MSKDRDSRKTTQDEKKKSLLGWFVSREEPDQDYMPELKSQWENFDLAGRIKFILGAFIGAILFFGALFLVYLLLSMMVG